VPIRRAAWIAAALVAFAPLVLRLPAAHAQSDLRKSFPGRRVGGGTRGDCASRLLAHLVPASSVFAPGQVRYLGVLEGPSPSPNPLELTFKPVGAHGRADRSMAEGHSRVLPPGGLGITLVTLPEVKVPTVWESTYVCPEAVAAPAQGDPLSFVATESPPTLSLLLDDVPSKEDVAVQAALVRLHQSCGSSVPRKELGAAFGLDDLFTAQWPERIPVRCPA
jgi:hypothetical protein